VVRRVLDHQGRPDQAALLHPPPAVAGADGASNLVLATHDFRPSFAKPLPRTNVRTPIFVRRHRRWTRLPSRSCSASQERRKEIKGSGTPKDAGPQPPHLATRLAPCKARSPSGVPPRLSPKGIIPSQRLGFRPGFLGRGLYGRYPPSPVPVQGCTSHPGHRAGRLMPKPPGSSSDEPPPAGTALAPISRGHRVTSFT
jgi:hypothetical protein